MNAASALASIVDALVASADATVAEAEEVAAVAAGVGETAGIEVEGKVEGARGPPPADCKWGDLVRKQIHFEAVEE